MTLTARPWALDDDTVRDVVRQDFDEQQLEAVIGVIAMFNYYTRVANATGIEFDYETPLPAFEPDVSQATADRPSRPAEFGGSASFGGGTDRGRRRPRIKQFSAAWETWRGYLLESEAPISPRDRQLLAAVAAEETTDWAGAAALGPHERPADDDPLVEFARKLSRHPWRMGPEDLERLRTAGYSEVAVLHVISVVAHQNADSRLAIGLGAVIRTSPADER
jgi:alkylhydroperoxidase family enzyme